MHTESQKKERASQVLKTMQDALSENLKELGTLVKSLKESKTKTKRKYYQKKVDHKRERVLGYMADVRHLEQLLESKEDDS